jgi:hypothetical protein
MRNTFSILVATRALLVTGCSSGIQTRPADTAKFEAANYHFYQWRSEPMVNTSNSSDILYTLDPIMRREIDAALSNKGYRLNPAKAEFTIDYIYSPGMLMGATSAETSNIEIRPTAIPNRQLNQAVVDNAYALGGVKETSNIGLQFNDVQSNTEVWHVVITKIVENVNRVDTGGLEKHVRKALSVGLKPLPKAQ